MRPRARTVAALAAAAVAGGAALVAVDWHEARQDENAQLDCLVHEDAPLDYARVLVIERDGRHVCVWVDGRGRKIREVALRY